MVLHTRKEVLGDDPSKATHVVGLSNGAIVAALLRGRSAEVDPNMTVTAVAGLVDLAAGLAFDFEAEQLQDLAHLGYCNKAF